MLPVIPPPALHWRSHLTCHKDTQAVAGPRGEESSVQLRATEESRPASDHRVSPETDRHPVQPSDNGSPCAQLDSSLVRNPEPEPPDQTTSPEKQERALSLEKEILQLLLTISTRPRAARFRSFDDLGLGPAGSVTGQQAPAVPFV
uniref:Uncharacterized protein n=1 Tax=Molossus molossus TaxID=27622 RepID=A0A7J8ERW1_MOLMO|nr:hypothetical protein HJG59_008735 [Molossus molossus]